MEVQRVCREGGTKLFRTRHVKRCFHLSSVLEDFRSLGVVVGGQT